MFKYLKYFVFLSFVFSSALLAMDDGACDRGFSDQELERIIDDLTSRQLNAKQADMLWQCLQKQREFSGPAEAKKPAPLRRVDFGTPPASPAKPKYESSSSPAKRKFGEDIDENMGDENKENDVDRDNASPKKKTTLSSSSSPARRVASIKEGAFSTTPTKNKPGAVYVFLSRVDGKKYRVPADAKINFATLLGKRKITELNLFEAFLALELRIEKTIKKLGLPMVENCVYVGETENTLQQRMRGHRSDLLSNKKTNNRKVVHVKRIRESGTEVYASWWLENVTNTFHRYMAEILFADKLDPIGSAETGTNEASLKLNEYYKWETRIKKLSEEGFNPNVPGKFRVGAESATSSTSSTKDEPEEEEET